MDSCEQTQCFARDEVGKGMMKVSDQRHPGTEIPRDCAETDDVAKHVGCNNSLRSIFWDSPRMQLGCSGIQGWSYGKHVARNDRARISRQK